MEQVPSSWNPEYLSAEPYEKNAYLESCFKRSVSELGPVVRYPQGITLSRWGMEDKAPSHSPIEAVVPVQL